jgi:hypothetical protein
MARARRRTADVDLDTLLVLSDAVKEDGLGWRPTNDLALGELAYARYLTPPQVAVLRWVFPSASVSFSYPASEVLAIPYPQRAKVPDLARRTAFEAATLDALLRLLRLNVNHHRRLLDTVVDVLFRIQLPPLATMPGSRPGACDEPSQCGTCQCCTYWHMHRHFGGKL